MEELIQKLREGTTAERIDAARALGKLGDPRVVPALKEVKNGLTQPHDEPYIVPGGFGNYYDSNPEQTRKVDPDQDLREAIEDAIRQLEK